MLDFNPITFLYDFYFKLVNFITTLWGFLNTEIKLGELTFTPLGIIGALGGTTIVILLIMKLIKEYIPLA